MINPLLPKFTLLILSIVVCQSTIIKAMDDQKKLEKICRQLTNAKPENIDAIKGSIHEYLKQVAPDQSQKVKQSLVETLAPTLAQRIWKYTHEDYKNGWNKHIIYFDGSVDTITSLHNSPPWISTLAERKYWHRLSFDQLLKEYVERVQTAPSLK